MSDKTFFDIHMHAFNLSHPSLLSFIQRLKIHRYLVLNSFLGPLASYLIGANFNKVKNLLAVMENDIGSYFLMLEEYLKKNGNQALLHDGKLNIGGNEYSRIVLTPLMMDFGYKGIKDNEDIYYNQPPQKPIVEQVVDVFNGIRKYQQKSPDKIFEIYPFLGINTQNYDMGRIEKMLDKYFKDYRGSREDFRRNIGAFDGDIEHLGSNFFAGIKLYPPLGFDPWPDDPRELEKVRYLYDYCCRKHIPVTVHGSEGGFVVVPSSLAKQYASISKWESVLGKYPELRINLAHFPVGEKTLWLFPRTKRLKETLNLVRKYQNVYVDFSNRAVKEPYYVSLSKLIKEESEKHQFDLTGRILFGSDFMINLMSIDSYNYYLEVFSGSGSFSNKEKDIFCSANPGHFIFP
jgi:hypothetical protein